MTTTSLICFPVTQAIYDAYQSDNPDLFDLRSPSPWTAHLTLWCDPSEYRPVSNELGEAGTDGVVVGYAATQVLISSRLEGFEIATVEGRQAAAQAIWQLHLNARQTPGQYQPIEVFDGHCLQLPGLPIVQFDGQSFVRRLMRLVSLTPTGGSLHNAGRTYSAGFTARFIDLSPRA